jgi:hypothetical protein
MCTDLHVEDVLGYLILLLNRITRYSALLIYTIHMCTFEQ